MSFINRLLIILPFFVLSLTLFAQETVILEQNPPSIKWQQINTPYFQIIFPTNFEEEAQRMANTMQEIYEPVSKTLDVKPKKLSIVLQNQNSISNAFVTVAPRRSEFFTMPPQDYNFIGTNDWLNLLAIHEFRHVVQYQKSLTGFTRAMQLVFGGNIWSFISFVGAPSWFWEGDAVAIETALTKSGRGRIPSFDMAFRTNLLERGSWNYHKQYLGSFNHYIPNHYVTGYHMVTHVRRNYGENSWSKIFQRTFNNPYIPFNFSRSIRKQTGYRLTSTYKNMINEVDSIWRWQVDQLETTESVPAVYRKNTIFTNYEYPQFLSDGKIFALRNGIQNISQFVYVDSLKPAKKIHTVGILNDPGMMAIGGDKIAWTEFAFDPRFAVRSYSVIKTYDFKKKKVNTITRKSRLSGIAISPDGNKIVAIENTTGGKNSLLIIDSKSGKELKRFENQENDFLSMPRWSDTGKHIVVLKSNSQGKTITQYSADGSQSKDLLPFSNENIGHPVQFKNYVLYNSPYSGIDNIYALDLNSSSRYQVTSKKHGSFNPAISPDGKNIAFNNFTIYGMDVEVMPFEPSDWLPLEKVEDRNAKYYEPLIEQEGNSEVLASIPSKKYEVKKYRELPHVLNPYSASLIYRGSEIGIALESQNILSTTNASIGATINGNERQPYFFARASYQKFFPIIDLGGSIGSRAIHLDQDGKYDRDSVFTWLEKSGTIGLRIPLNLTRNKYYQGLLFGAHTSITHISNQTVPEGYSIEGEGLMNKAEYSLSYYALLKQAHRNVTTRWGVTASVMYKNTPIKIDYSGALFAAQGKLYFPGVMRNDGIQIRGGYQTQEMNTNYSFVSPLFLPRGYGYTSHDNFYNGSVEYKFPIWNADVHIGSIFNFQRFKGKFFFDRGIGTTGNSDTHYESMGAELHMDFNFMRWIPLLEMGVRWTYIPNKNLNYFDLMLFQFNM